MTAAELTTTDTEWQAAAYEQFLRDDSAEDAIYQNLVEEQCPTKSEK